MWTLFWDMHSGGETKQGSYEKIYIEAPEEEAKVIFYNRFGHNPERVTCTCCGSDYSISSEESFAQISGYHRGCDYVKGKYIEKVVPDNWSKYQTVAQYKKNGDVLIIPKSKIKKSERTGNVPEEGYVWKN